MNNNLPYGSGSVIYIKENKLHPYQARRYKGNNANGNPTYIRLGSYATPEEARAALLEKRDSSADDLKNERLTLLELFTLYMEENCDQYAKDTLITLRSTIKKCEKLYNVAYSDIKAYDMREIIKQTESLDNRRNIKRLFNKLDNQAEMLNIPGKRQAQFIPRIRWKPTDKVVDRVPFTNAEIMSLKLNADDKDMHIPLIMCYTGFRQGEFRSLLKEKVNLEVGTMTGGFKTEAGTNRVIPIHPFIMKYIERLMDSPGKYLLSNEKGNMMSEWEFNFRFQMAVAPYIERHHVNHECRHTFRTRLDAMNVKENIIRSLMGHAQMNQGDRSYFHPSIEQLREGIMQLWP